jgi:hypothetical protein
MNKFKWLLVSSELNISRLPIISLRLILFNCFQKEQSTKPVSHLRSSIYARESSRCSWYLNLNGRWMLMSKRSCFTATLRIDMFTNWTDILYTYNHTVQRQLVTIAFPIEVPELNLVHAIAFNEGDRLKASFILIKYWDWEVWLTTAHDDNNRCDQHPVNDLCLSLIKESYLETKQWMRYT